MDYRPCRAATAERGRRWFDGGRGWTPRVSVVRSVGGRVASVNGRIDPYGSTGVHHRDASTHDGTTRRSYRSTASSSAGRALAVSTSSIRERRRRRAKGRRIIYGGCDTSCRRTNVDCHGNGAAFQESAERDHDPVGAFGRCGVGRAARSAVATPTRVPCILPLDPSVRSRAMRRVPGMWGGPVPMQRM